MKPYKDSVEVQHGTQKEYIIREFSDNTNEDELGWHRDKTSRRVHVLRGKGWKLQMDDSLPEEMMVGHDYWIPEMVYHRVIKGENALVLRIENI